MWAMRCSGWCATVPRARCCWRAACCPAPRRTLRPCCYAVPGLPRTNNDLEHLFGAQRYHERRASGRKAASPATVLRGEVRLIAATATRLRPPAVRELGRVSRERWTRFRRNPDAYLAAFEQQAGQSALPT